MPLLIPITPRKKTARQRAALWRGASLGVRVKTCEACCAARVMHSARKSSVPYGAVQHARVRDAARIDAVAAGAALLRMRRVDRRLPARCFARMRENICRGVSEKKSEYLAPLRVVTARHCCYI